MINQVKCVFRAGRRGFGKSGKLTINPNQISIMGKDDQELFSALPTDIEAYKKPWGAVYFYQNGDVAAATTLVSRSFMMFGPLGMPLSNGNTKAKQVADALEALGIRAK